MKTGFSSKIINLNKAITYSNHKVFLDLTFNRFTGNLNNNNESQSEFDKIQLG